MNFYSNGKLLLTGEYVVLDGAISLAVPTKFGQDLLVDPIKESLLLWRSFSHTGECWFEATFDVPKLRLQSATFTSDKEGSAEFIAETLCNILKEAKKINPSFLGSTKGYIIKTNLDFPRNWGLGSSSTLVNNIAQWAKIDAYQLLWNSFSGSGYDIANAQYNSPILYRLKNEKPIIETVDFVPEFSNQLFFVHLNKKQNSKEGIAKYRESSEDVEKQLGRISEISSAMIVANSLLEFENLMEEHEQIISSLLQVKPVKEALFSDYDGAVKSLGAWGGDFVLATGDKDSMNYFKEKGFSTILSYTDMVL